jgi:hypothetical protein
MSNFKVTDGYSRKYIVMAKYLHFSVYGQFIPVVKVISVGNFEIKKCFLSFDPESQWVS